MYDAAVKWAMETGDNLLNQQVQAVVFVHKFQKSLILAEQASRKSLNAKLLKDRIPSSPTVKVIQDMRSTLNALLKFVEQHDDIFDDGIGDQHYMHLPSLAKTLALRSLLASAEKQSQALLSKVTHVYEEDIRALVQAIDEICPKWQHKAETMLSDRDLVQQFLSMTEPRTAALGPMISTLSNYMAALKSQPPLINPAVNAQATITYGIQTGVYKYVIDAIERDFLKLSSPAECEAAVKRLRAAVSQKNVHLTKEMEASLDAWASGAKLEEAAAGGWHSDSGVPSTPRNGAAEAAEPVPATAEVRPPEIAQACTEVRPSGGKTLSLAARAAAAAAKRRKLA